MQNINSLEKHIFKIKMKNIRIQYFFVIFVLFSFNASGQRYFKVIYNQDTYYTFNSQDFFDSKFRKPDSVPDGKWIILNDTIPSYIFNTYQNCVHGEYMEFLGGILSDEGKYRMDSLWTFRFNKEDERFRDSIWIHKSGMVFDRKLNTIKGFQYIFQQTYNKWYPNGIREYEKRGQNIEIWYYQSGTIKKMNTTYSNEKDNILFEQSFDTIGDLRKIIITRKKKNGLFISSNTIEYNGIWKTMEIIEDNKHIETIQYGAIGEVVKRVSKKRNER